MNKQHKLTKKELKGLKGPNAAVQHSLDKGDLHHVGGTAYSGRVPRYTMMPSGRFIKTAKGIPFVRVTLD